MTRFLICALCIYNLAVVAAGAWVITRLAELGESWGWGLLFLLCGASFKSKDSSEASVNERASSTLVEARRSR